MENASGGIDMHEKRTKTHKKHSNTIQTPKIEGFP